MNSGLQKYSDRSNSPSLSLQQLERFQLGDHLLPPRSLSGDSWFSTTGRNVRFGDTIPNPLTPPPAPCATPRDRP